MTRTLELTASDGLRLAIPLAGIGSRFAAWLIDWWCSVALAVACTQVAGLFIVFGADAVLAARILSYFSCNIAYGIASEWIMRGQSVGKRLLGLRVVDVGGRRLRFSQVALRNLLRFLDMLPAAYAVGGLSVVLSSRSQRLGDMLANTAVVAARPLVLPALESAPPSEWNSLRSDLSLVAGLRRALDAEFALLAFDAVLRRDEFEPGARVALFGELAAAVTEKVRLPAELVQSMSDERLVRNVVDVLCSEAPEKAGSARGLSVRPRRATLPALQGTVTR